MSEGVRLYCSPQSWDPSATLTNSLLIISLLSSRKTRIIITALTLSRWPTCCGSIYFPLNLKAVLHASTRSFGIRESMLIMLSVMPSERYSTLKSLSEPSKGITTRESISSSPSSNWTARSDFPPVRCDGDSSVTSPMNRYPRRGTVSINCLLHPVSLNVFRNVDMLTVILFSSTNESGQIAFINSSFVISCPRFFTRNSKRSRILGVSGTGWSWYERRSCASSRRKPLNS